MDIMFRHVAGLDVHKETIFVCVRWFNAQGKLEEVIDTFGTTTRELLRLMDWLTGHSVTHVAMESTGVFWKPIWNVLEGAFQLLLVNPRELKQVPGRKSDVKDCQWIAQLLQYGLLRSSFVPPCPQRELRDLTRHRAQLQGERTRIANRIHKLLADANLKLSNVATDILGVSGRAMLEQLAAGQQDPQQLAQLAVGKLRKKIPLLVPALEGKFTPHHRFMLRQLLQHLSHLERQIEEFNQRIEEAMAPFVEKTLIEELKRIPGFDQRTIENVLAEIGPDMSPFPTSAHLASWAGVCPGNEQSAGKRKRSRTTSGNRWLQRALSEAAWAASRTKHTYLSDKYRRLAARRGKKRAIIAIAHILLTIVHLMIEHRVPYRDLGEDYLTNLDPERLKRYLVKRLQKLGYDVTLTDTKTAA